MAETMAGPSLDGEMVGEIWAVRRVEYVSISIPTTLYRPVLTLLSSDRLYCSGMGKIARGRGSELQRTCN